MKNLKHTESIPSNQDKSRFLKLKKKLPVLIITTSTVDTNQSDLQQLIILLTTKLLSHSEQLHTISYTVCSDFGNQENCSLGPTALHFSV